LASRPGRGLRSTAIPIELQGRGIARYIIGPGDGDWTVSLAAVGGEPGTFILASNVADGPRQILNSAAVCDGDTASIIYTVESGSGFGIDAVAVFPGNG
jgi:hypothetical protein